MNYNKMDFGDQTIRRYSKKKSSKFNEKVMKIETSRYVLSNEITTF